MNPLPPDSLVRKLSFFLVLINLGMSCLSCYLLLLLLPDLSWQKPLSTIIILSIFAGGSLLLVLHLLFALSISIPLPPKWLWVLTMLFSFLLIALLSGLQLTLFFTVTSIVLSIGALIALSQEQQSA